MYVGCACAHAFCLLCRLPTNLPKCLVQRQKDRYLSNLPGLIPGGQISGYLIHVHGLAVQAKRVCTAWPTFFPFPLLSEYLRMAGLVVGSVTKEDAGEAHHRDPTTYVLTVWPITLRLDVPQLGRAVVVNHAAQHLCNGAFMHSCSVLVYPMWCAFVRPHILRVTNRVPTSLSLPHPPWVRPSVPLCCGEVSLCQLSSTSPMCPICIVVGVSAGHYVCPPGPV